jgi:hypothetical protein
MFDGIGRLPMRRPIPPRPASLDTRPLLPMLRAQAAEGAVEALAHAVALNTDAAAGWVAANWGSDADTRDPSHPVHVYAAEPGSPFVRLAEAQEALATACHRYRSKTGHDGVALARRVIEGRYGARLAAAALAPLDAAKAIADEVAAVFKAETPPPPAGAELDGAIDDLLSCTPEPPASEPTPEQSQAYRSTIAEWLLTDPVFDGITERLGALLSACRAAEADGCPNVSAAVESLEVSIGDALRAGVDPDVMQALLDYWSLTTGGPRVDVTVGGA